MEIRKVPIEKLNPAPYNPRKDLQPDDAEYQKLKRSIEEFGYIDPIIWNESSGNILSGHQRLKILIDSGINEVEVSVVHMDDITEKTANVALNNISGTWDEDKLEEILRELLAVADVSITGFDEKELDKMLNEANEAAQELISEQNNNNGGKSFNYQEQYGVIIICKDEAEQEMVYNSLYEQGYKCKVVAT